MSRPCCSSRCTRSPWRAWPGTAATAATRGAGCSARRSFLATTTFGTVDDAEAAIARVRGIHERIRGKDPRGRAYRASDPHLLRWVHVAEAYGFLTAHQRYALQPLTAAEADTYVVQSALVAGRLGATDLPTTVADLGDALTAYRPELEATAEARDAARFLLLDPPLPWVARPGYGLIATGGVAVLPAWARRALRLPVVGPGASLAVRRRPARHRARCAGRWPAWPRSVSSWRTGPDRRRTP